MCSNLYLILLEFYNSGSSKKAKEKLEIELRATKYAIRVAIPYLEKRIYNCESEYVSKYYELWEKFYAFAARRSLEHFIDYMEMEMPVENRVLGNRRNVLKPFVFYLNKCAFDDKLQYIEASYPPRIWKKLYS